MPFTRTHPDHVALRLLIRYCSYSKSSLSQFNHVSHENEPSWRFPHFFLYWTSLNSKNSRTILSWFHCDNPLLVIHEEASRKLFALSVSAIRFGRRFSGRDEPCCRRRLQWLNLCYWSTSRPEGSWLYWRAQLRNYLASRDSPNDILVYWARLSSSLGYNYKFVSKIAESL